MEKVQQVWESRGRKTTFEISLSRELNSNRMDFFMEWSSQWFFHGKRGRTQDPAQPSCIPGTVGFPNWAGGCGQSLSAQTNLSCLGLSKLSPNRLKHLASSLYWDQGFHNLITPGIKEIFLWSVLKPLPDTLIGASASFITSFISLFLIPQDFSDLHSHSHIFQSINPFYISPQLYFPLFSFLLVAHNGLEQRQNAFLFCLVV